jgi:acyl dehydratase
MSPQTRPVAASPQQAKAGDAIPVFQRTAGLAEWNRYAAVNDEFVPIHMDDEAGRAAGFPGAIGMGRLQWSYLHNMLRDWLPPGGRIVAVQAQLRAPNRKGSTITAHGIVTAVHTEGGIRRIDLNVWIDDEQGTRLAPGSATVELADAPASLPHDRVERTNSGR